MATATKSESKVRLNPLGDRICVLRDDPEKESPGGIILPDAAQSQQQIATVKAVCPGKLLNDGTRAGAQVKIGDRVVIGMYGPEVITIGDEEFMLIREDDVLATIEGEPTD